MTEKIRGIVLDIRKHNDNNNIVTLFTPSHGRLTFISSVSSSRAGRLRQARLLPLALIETEFNYNPSKNFHRLGTFSLSEVWDDIYFNPIKRIMIFFISEFLNRIIRASMPDPLLWSHIKESITYFNNDKDRFYDFHLTFLISTLQFLGIQPDSTTYSNGYIFDMREGKFCYHKPLHNDFLDERESKIASILLKSGGKCIPRLKLSRNHRNTILDNLLRYYEIHYPGTGNIRALETIREILA